MSRARTQMQISEMPLSSSESTKPQRSAWDEAVLTIRFLSTDAVEQAQAGHPGTPMALAGIGVDLYTRYLRWVPEDPAWPNRDRRPLLGRVDRK